MIESFNDTTATPQFYKEGNVSRGRSYAFTLTYMMFDIQTTFNAKLILFYSPNQTRGIVGPHFSCNDCIYVREALEVKGGYCRIAPRTTFSDHSPIIDHFQMCLKWGSFQPRIPKTIYTDAKVKEQLPTQWSLPVNDSSSSEKLLSKLTTSNLPHKIIKTRSRDTQEKRQIVGRGHAISLPNKNSSC